MNAHGRKQNINQFENSARQIFQSFKDDFRFTRSQFLLVQSWVNDCLMWQEVEFLHQISRKAQQFNSEIGKLSSRQKRDCLFDTIRKTYHEFAAKEKAYPSGKKYLDLPRYTGKTARLKGDIYRTCQAYSNTGVCCGLKVLNIVDNCAMDCAYCILQSHYEKPVVSFPSNLKEKLSEIKIPAHKRFRVGPGEHSDALLWGNQNGMLDDLCDFAASHPNIILELKTKSANVDYFLKRPIPPNVCCSWSINAPVVISNEEHKTAALGARLAAARNAADKGVKVAFHCHPMIFFKGWEKEYQYAIQRAVNLFSPREVLWFSLGTITYMRELPKFLRKNFRYSKVLQMDTEVTADNKITYKSAIREKLYKHALNVLRPWKDRVFLYLCMEFDKIWEKTMGFTYQSSEEFNDAINTHAFKKLDF